MESKKFLSVQDVAVRWGLSYNTVRDVIRGGKLPAARLGGRRFRVDLSDVEAYESASKTTGVPAGVW